MKRSAVGLLQFYKEKSEENRHQRIYINNHAVCLCSSFSLDDVLGFHNLSQIVLIIHLADATGHTSIIGQSILQHKASHTGLTTIHQILMNSLETLLAVVIVCMRIYMMERFLERLAQSEYRDNFIIINSLRKFDIDPQPFTERPIDCKAGYKHHLTKDYLKHLQKSLIIKL